MKFAYEHLAVAKAEGYSRADALKMLGDDSLHLLRYVEKLRWNVRHSPYS